MRLVAVAAEPLLTPGEKLARMSPAHAAALPTVLLCPAAPLFSKSIAIHAHSPLLIAFLLLASVTAARAKSKYAQPLGRCDRSTVTPEGRVRPTRTR